MNEIISNIGNSGSISVNNGLSRVIRPGRDLSFQDVLKARLENESGIKFSSHALNRLSERGITLGSEDISRLSDAVAKAGGKGAKDSLILVDDKAFIVNINNRTVVTAMTGDNIKSNVFTNIDSAVIA
jgi:flagellar operon protein